MESVDFYAVARAPVPPPSSGVVTDGPNQRQRFFVELAPEETTIVSWQALVRQANNEVVAHDSPHEEEDSEDHIPVEKSSIKEGGSVVNRDIVRHRSDENKSSISLNIQNKAMRKVIMDSVTSTALQKLQELKSKQHDLQSRSLMSKNYEQEGFNNFKHRNSKGSNLPDRNLPYTEHASVLMETSIEFSVDSLVTTPLFAS